ncbi:TetR family transcriptional regulator protein [Rhizobium etli bv. phaseoli str. IE4803]|nr:TetR family transcriptional regulator protein [Rhizobium etli bv. phaseoli str. IE4803]
MSLPPRVMTARNLFKQHLDQRDWSDLTPGRRRILEVFLKLATYEGYSAVTMRLLAKEANVKASSIYFHFPEGRSEIVAESLRWHYSNWGYAVLEAIDKTSSVDEFWDALVVTAAKRQISHPASDLWDLLVRMDRIGGFLEIEFRHEIDHWLDLCAGLFETAAEEMGYLPSKRAVRAIMALLDAASTWCEWSGDPAELEACADQAVLLSRTILTSQEKIARAALSCSGG